MATNNLAIAKRLATQRWLGGKQSQLTMAPGIWEFTQPNGRGRGSGIIVDTNLYPEFKPFNCPVRVKIDTREYLPEEQHFAAFETGKEEYMVMWLHPYTIHATYKRVDPLRKKLMTREQWQAQVLKIAYYSLKRDYPAFLAKYPKHGALNNPKK